MTFTYQTRLELDAPPSKILDECAELLSLVERKLFAEIAKGKKSSSLKNEFLKKYQITARQFNGCRISIEGKVSSIKKRRKELIKEKKRQIKVLEKKIKFLNKRKTKKSKSILHQKKRRLFILQTKLKKMEKDQEENRLRICFGSKKLFNAQFNLKENGYKNHNEWKRAFDFHRNNEFFLVGSKDETFGNQTCQAIPQENGALTLKLRIPNGFVKDFGKYLIIKDVSFQYGHKEIISALTLPNAISYRFKKDKKSWRVFASTEFSPPPIVTNKIHGIIGIDINSNNIALARIDRFGNIVDKKSFPLNTYGKTKNQTKALIGDVCKKIIEEAEKDKVPIVIEKLDFQKKKTALREKTKKHARMLSSFSYKTIISFLKSRALKNGIEVIEVNPAYTSLIGRVKFAKKYGLSIDHSAAFCIARRALRLSENPPTSLGNIPDGRGDHVALSLPARIRGKHIWSFWNRVSRKLKTELAAHFRAIKKRSLDPPLPVLETGNSRKLLV
jgi:IS605 OrfB family transposase